MGTNINQIPTQATTIESTDKLYLGRLPYGATDDRYFFGGAVLLNSATASPTPGMVPFCQGGANNQRQLYDANFVYDNIKSFLTVGGLGFSDTTQAGLELQSLTQTQIDALGTPFQGDLVANTTTARPNYYDGSAMQEIAYTADLPLISGVNVGTSAQYTSFGEAFSSVITSNGFYQFNEISDVTEVQNYTFTFDNAVMLILKPEYSLNIGDYSIFNYGTTNTTFLINGNLSTINYARTTDSPLFDAVASTTPGLIINNLQVNDSTSADVDSYMVYATSPSQNVNISNLNYSLPNTNKSGIYVSTMQGSNITFIGNGTSCGNALTSTSAALLSRIVMVGTYDTSVPQISLSAGLLGNVICVANNDINISLGNLSRFENGFAYLSGFNVTALENAEIDINNVGSLALILQDNTMASLDQCHIKSIDDSAATATRLITFNSCEFTAPITLGTGTNAPVYSIIGGALPTAINIDSGDCIINAASGDAGLTTITVGASAGVVTISNCTNVTIIDNSGHAQIIGNTPSNLTDGQVLGGVTGSVPKPMSFVAGTNMTSIDYDEPTSTLTFNADSGGGASWFTATIGTGGDYLTVASALTALITTTTNINVRLVFLTSITEVSSFTWPTGSNYNASVYIYIPHSFQWETDNYNIFTIDNSLTLSVTIESPFAYLYYNFTSNNSWFKNNSSTGAPSLTFIGQINIVNQSTVGVNSYLYKDGGTNASIIRFIGNHAWTTRNNIASGIYGNQCSVYVNGALNITGGGSSCAFVIISGLINADKLQAQGTFDSSTPTIAAELIEINSLNLTTDLYMSVIQKVIISSGLNSSGGCGLDIANNAIVILNDLTNINIISTGTNVAIISTDCGFSVYDFALTGASRLTNALFNNIDISINTNNSVLIGCGLINGTLTLEPGVQNNQIGFFHSTNGGVDIVDNSGNASNLQSVISSF
jgi:hypothetical protein